MAALAVLAVVIIAVGHVLGTWAGIAAGLLAGAGAYWLDVKCRPLVPCRVCKGRGSHGSLLFAKPFGLCWCCRGSKSHPRFAARLLTPKAHADMKAGRHGRYY
jgi:hypothetical protein